MKKNSGYPRIWIIKALICIFHMYLKDKTFFRGWVPCVCYATTNLKLSLRMECTCKGLLNAPWPRCKVDMHMRATGATAWSRYIYIIIYIYEIEFLGIWGRGHFHAPQAFSIIFSSDLLVCSKFTTSIYAWDKSWWHMGSGFNHLRHFHWMFSYDISSLTVTIWSLYIYIYICIYIYIYIYIYDPYIYIYIYIYM